MALDGNGRWCYLDPRLGAMHAVAEAARKVACSGRDSRGRNQLPEFRQSREAAHYVAVLANHPMALPKACEELEIPITGGNVSF